KGEVRIGVNHLKDKESRPQIWFTLYSKKDREILSNILKGEEFWIKNESWQFRLGRGNKFYLRTYAGDTFRYIEKKVTLPKNCTGAGDSHYKALMDDVKKILENPLPLSSSANFLQEKEVTQPHSLKESFQKIPEETVDLCYKRTVALIQEFAAQFAYYDFSIAQSITGRPSQFHFLFSSSIKRDEFMDMLKNKYRFDEFQSWQKQGDFDVRLTATQTEKLMGLCQNEDNQKIYESEWNIKQDVLKQLKENERAISYPLYNQRIEDVVSQKIDDAMAFIAKIGCDNVEVATFEDEDKSFQIKLTFSDSQTKDRACAILVEQYNCNLADLQQSEKAITFNASQFERAIGLDSKNPIGNAAKSQVINKLQEVFSSEQVS
ncbi:MAG: hypothetical protein WAM28_09260, partial [Chlamydiales bacterium]